MRSAFDHLKRRTLWQVVQRRIDPVIVQVRVLAPTDDQRGNRDLFQVDQFPGCIDTDITPPAVGAVFPIIVPGARSQHFDHYGVCDSIIERAIFCALDVVHRVLPGVVVEWLSHFIFTYAAENRRIQHELVKMLRVFGCAPTSRHCTPAPAEEVDLVLPGDLANHVNSCVDVLGGIVRIRQEAILDIARLTEARDVQPPDGIAFARKYTHKAVILVIDVKLMGGVGDAVDEQDVPVRLRSLNAHSIQVQGDPGAFQRVLCVCV